MSVSKLDHYCTCESELYDALVSPYHITQWCIVKIKWEHVWKTLNRLYMWRMLPISSILENYSINSWYSRKKCKVFRRNYWLYCHRYLHNKEMSSKVSLTDYFSISTLKDHFSLHQHVVSGISIYFHFYYWEN